MKMWDRIGALSVPAMFWPTVTSAQMIERSGEYWHSDWGWGHMIFGSFMMVVFWALVIAAVVLVVRAFIGRPHAVGKQTAGNDPLAILRERYARGEIDREEFDDRKRRLEE